MSSAGKELDHRQVRARCAALSRGLRPRDHRPSSDRRRPAVALRDSAIPTDIGSCSSTKTTSTVGSTSSTCGPRRPDQPARIGRIDLEPGNQATFEDIPPRELPGASLYSWVWETKIAYDDRTAVIDRTGPLASWRTDRPRESATILDSVPPSIMVMWVPDRRGRLPRRAELPGVPHEPQIKKLLLCVAAHARWQRAIRRRSSTSASAATPSCAEHLRARTPSAEDAERHRAHGEHAT